ncbi:hypothetical protein GCM10022297_00470 [Lactobacillus hamsteri]|uniref:ArsR family transcriptional regulator n=1 Tax=Lactobacillus hamsteri DSM 5661 = JCM 6256 TaxID=1423754 RepID=A0A0R1Y9M6_9LACO|nr:Rgg/GadR/MutR family transcriptional regulator [Lactobacillus hamsteri]KRM39134.1 ArsR family transcriptional regulator [Lactobacillus hamsteri DSM 5661 = JCM 6256]
MNIGEVLKEERKRLNLSQSQMAGEILTKSFYSKVERGLFSIRTDDLLHILDLHNIDYSAFFKKVQSKKDDEELTEAKCMDLLHTAYYEQDYSKIVELRNLLKQRDTNKLNLCSINAQIIIVESSILGKLGRISETDKKHIKEAIFETNNWTENGLRLFSISMFMFNSNDINSILKTILSNIRDINSVSKEKQKIVSAILVNYLNYVAKNSKNIVMINVDKALKILDSLAVDPNNCFAKIMMKYYFNVFSGNVQEAEEVLKFLDSSGMHKIVEKIRK